MTDIVAHWGQLKLMSKHLENKQIKIEVYLFIFNLFFWLLYTACRILVPRPATAPGTSAVKARNPNHWTAGELPS